MILSRRGSYFKPLLTPRGDQVVYSDYPASVVHVVNFDGSQSRKVTDGVAIAVWRDPKTQTQYVYFGVDRTPTRTVKPVYRIPLDGSGERELVWDRTEISLDNFQLSADGRYAAAAFPWPHAGIADLQTQNWTKLGTGCWTSMAPDDSLVSWVFDGPHHNVYLYKGTNQSRWRVPVNRAPGIDGYEVYHPRWSNHPRLIVMTGPYKKGTGANRIGSGGLEVEIYLGRFNKRLTEVEQWIQVTHNEKADFYPNAWIEGAEDYALGEVGPVGLNPEDMPDAPEDLDAMDRWPGNRADLMFLWENNMQTNAILDDNGSLLWNCNVLARGRAKFGRFHEMDVEEGAFIAPDVSERLLQASQSSDALTIEVVIKPYQVIESGAARRILSFSNGPENTNFMLGQKAERLVCAINTTGTAQGEMLPLVDLDAVTPYEYHHVVLSYFPGNLYCYIDGQLAHKSALLQGGFDHWRPDAQLVFGNELLGANNWEGLLEGVAIYNRFVTPEEAAHKFDIFKRQNGKRAPIERFRVRARLVETTTMPTVDALQEYSRALVVHCYEVVRVIEGDIDTERILVAHWGIMNNRVIPRAEKLQIGQEYRLLLQRYEDHPQLESERQFNDCEDITLPLFYDIDRVGE